MSKPQTNHFTTLETTERPQLCYFDFDRVQVAPQQPDRQEDFHSLSLSERQALLEKLIKRVKTL